MATRPPVRRAQVVTAPAATTRRPARTAASTIPAAAPAAVEPLVLPRLVIEYMDITDIVPYEWNPRLNAEAVKSVAESIKLTSGFAMPVVVDNDGVLVAGHTRVEAAKTLGITEVPVVRLSHLSREQINAFRLVDNKVSEAAKWDFDMLAGEIGKLEGSGIDFTNYGWSSADLDCMQQLVAADCLEATDLAPVAQAAAAEATANAAGRAPTQARFVLGEIILYLPVSEYRPWADGIRALCDYSEAAIAEEIKRRLGITG